MFEVEGTKSIDAGKLNFKENGINFVARINSNNGVQGKIDKQEFEPNEANVLTATVIGNYKYVKYQTSPFYCSQNINKLTPKKFKLNRKNALYFMCGIRKFVEKYNNQQAGYKLEDIKMHILRLPQKKDKPDFAYMEKYIELLDAVSLEQLNAYLKVTMLSDYELTIEEQEALNADVEWVEFKIIDWFEKLDLRKNNKTFDKKLDVSPVPNDEFSVPLVNAKIGSNGIMFYGRATDFDVAEMTIDIISNGAIATGTVYAQPQKTGVLWDAYLLKPKFDEMNKQILLYLSTALEKSIKLKFSWDNKAVWSKVQHEKFICPEINSEPDIDFMQTYIQAIQKIVIKDVIEYAKERCKLTEGVASNKYETDIKIKG